MPTGKSSPRQIGVSSIDHLEINREITTPLDIAPPNKVRIKVDKITKKLVYSTDGGPYVPFASTSDITSVGYLQLINDDSVTLLIGQPVAIVADKCRKANSDTVNNTIYRPAIGLVSVSNTIVGAVASIQTSGTLQQSDWTFITGTALLTPGSTYYLYSDINTPQTGMLSAIPPTIIGTTLNNALIVQKIGVAVSTDTLDIRISDYIIL